MPGYKITFKIPSSSKTLVSQLYFKLDYFYFKNFQLPAKSTVYPEDGGCVLIKWTAHFIYEKVAV